MAAKILLQTTTPYREDDWHGGRFSLLRLVALDDADMERIMRCRRLGAGVLTARDHQDMGSCLCGLGTLGMVNYSGANDDYQRIAALKAARPFNLTVVVQGEQDQDGRALGNAVASSSFHHFADYNWDTDMGCPSFVTDRPGYEIKHDPSRLEIFKDYVRNIARWLRKP